MEELLELTKKQLRFQKMITAFLAIMVVMFMVVGIVFMNRMNQMTVAMNEAVEKLETIDVDALNDTITSTSEMIESVDDFSNAVDELTAHVQEFDGWLSGLFGKK